MLFFNVEDFELNPCLEHCEACANDTI